MTDDRSPDPRYHLPRLGGPTYRNPLAFADGISRTAPDPFAFKHRGRYYCVATDVDGVTVASSDDLVTWHHHGFAFRMPGRQEYWAPCVLVHDGRFHLYVSTAPERSTDPHDERLMVAVSDDPLGPYEYVDTLFDTFSIDPHVVRDVDGSLWLFYSTNDVMGLDRLHPGTSILVDRLLDPATPARDPRVVVVPTLVEEVFEVDRFGDGRDWHTIEGATYLRHRDRAFLTYSGNSYVRHDYFIGFSRAVGAESIGDLAWAKYPNDADYRPLVRRNDVVAGTGHNSIVTAPNLVDSWLLYHGRQADEPLDPAVEQRTMRLDPLFVDGDRLDTNAPSSAPQDAPAQPGIRDDFDGDGLSADWGSVEGEWRTGDRMARTSSIDGRAVVLTAQRVGSYRAEVDLAATPTHVGARFGVVAAHLGDDDRVEVVLDAGRMRVEALQVTNGIGIELGSATLPRIDLTVFHLLGVDRIVDRIAVSLDGVPVLDVRAPEGPASFGLVAYGTAARFSGFSLTEHLELWGESLKLLPRLYRAADRADLGPAGLDASGREVRLESLDPPLGTVTVHDFELLGRDLGRVEFWPAHDEHGSGVLVEAEGDGIRVLLVRGDTREPLLEAPLPERSFSVRATVLPDRVAVRAGGRTVLAHLETAGSRQSITLRAARLRGLQRTGLAGSFDATQPSLSVIPSGSGVIR